GWGAGGVWGGGGGGGGGGTGGGGGGGGGGAGGRRNRRWCRRCGVGCRPCLADNGRGVHGGGGRDGRLAGDERREDEGSGSVVCRYAPAGAGVVGVAETEDHSVVGEHPVARGVGGRDDSNDGSGRRVGPERTEERPLGEVEDPTVTAHQQVAAAVGHHAGDGLAEGRGGHVTFEDGVTEGRYRPPAAEQPVALTIRGGDNPRHRESASERGEGGRAERPHRAANRRHPDPAGT